MHRKRVLGSVGAVASAAALATGGAALAFVVNGDSARGLSKAEAAAAKRAALAANRVPTIDFAKRQSIVRHLRSLGIDPRAVVFQRGKRNYAGPNCPGRDWNCTTATQVVQLASHNGGENHAVCKGENATLETPNKCVIVQGSLTESGNNHAVCIMRSHSPDATQSCEITQATATGRNHATAHQSVENTVQGTQQNTPPGSEQNARQEIQITQDTASGRNIAEWSSRAKFASHHRNGGAQDQDVHQVALITQRAQDVTIGGETIPATGDSRSAGGQAHDLIAHAQGGAITQDQNQKPSPFGDCHPDNGTPTGAQLTQPNACAVIYQVSGSGDLSSKLHQDSDLDAKAKTDVSIAINQGTPVGGLDYGIGQHTTGLATWDHPQREDFDANPDLKATPNPIAPVLPAGAVFVHQEGPMYGGGSPPPHQTSNPDSRAVLDQVSRLHVHTPSSPGGPVPIPYPIVQNSALGAFYVTTGTAFLHQLAETNTGFYEEEAEGNVVTGEVRCVGTDDDDGGNGDGDDDGVEPGSCAGFTVGTDDDDDDTTDTTTPTFL